MRISDGSSDVCSSDLTTTPSSGASSRRCARSDRRRAGQESASSSAAASGGVGSENESGRPKAAAADIVMARLRNGIRAPAPASRSEEHTSELQSLMRISYAVFCLKKKKEKKILQVDTHKIE